MTRKKKLFFAGGLLCLSAMAWGYFLYTKPRSGVASAHTDKSVTAAVLYQRYAADEHAAALQFDNKVVVVTGTVAAVQNATGSASVLLSATGEPGGGINCSLAAGEKAEDQLVGKQVCIKGRCTGYLMDVNLVDAILVKGDQ